MCHLTERQLLKHEQHRKRTKAGISLGGTLSASELR